MGVVLDFRGDEMNQQALAHMNARIEHGWSRSDFDDNGQLIEGRPVDVTGHGSEYQRRPGYNVWTDAQRRESEKDRLHNLTRKAIDENQEALDKERKAGRNDSQNEWVEDRNFVNVNGQDVKQAPETRSWIDILFGRTK